MYTIATINQMLTDSNQIKELLIISMESLATNYNSKFGLLPNQSPDFHEKKKDFRNYFILIRLNYFRYREANFPVKTISTGFAVDCNDYIMRYLNLSCTQDIYNH